MTDEKLTPERAVERPKWVAAIRSFVSDEVIDPKHGWPDDGRDDWAHDLIESAMLTVMCNIYGHDIEDDQCMIPEHRYCVYCGRREPALLDEGRTDEIERLRRINSELVTDYNALLIKQSQTERLLDEGRTDQ